MNPSTLRGSLSLSDGDSLREHFGICGELNGVWLAHPDRIQSFELIFWPLSAGLITTFRTWEMVCPQAVEITIIWTDPMCCVVGPCGGKKSEGTAGRLPKEYHVEIGKCTNGPQLVKTRVIQLGRMRSVPRAFSELGRHLRRF